MITASQKKTDRNDAEMLARLGRADLRLLSPVEHRGNATQADLAVAKTRKLLVESRTKQINSIRGMVKAFGERLQECDSEGFHRVTRSTLPPALKPALEPMYEVLGMLETQIKVLDKTLAKMAERYPDVKVISQINGVGLLTALVFLLTVEDKTRFKQSRDAGAFFGMVPRKDQSGDTDKQLGITKGGDAFVRSLLVNSANYIMGPFGAPSDLRTWGNKLAARGGKNARKRAKVAVARKLAVLMHRLWVTGEVYEPLRNSTKTERATA
jgi:transposase